MLCPFCGHENARKNKICGQCGRPLLKYKSSRNIVISLVAMSAVLIAVIFSINRLSKKAAFSGDKAQLEILYSAAYHSRTGDMIVEGKIRNISGMELDDVHAAVNWYGKNREFLIKSSEVIELNPLSNLQISPFEVKIPYQDAMRYYDISFDSNGKVLLAVELSDKIETPLHQ